MVEDFFIKLDNLISTNSRPIGERGCLEWMKKKSKSGYGSVQLTLPGQSKKRLHTTIHRAAYMLKKHEINIPKYDNDNNQLDVSHLCHNAWCVNTEHLVLEPHFINSERTMCKTSNNCIGHTPECMVEVCFVNILLYFYLICTCRNTKFNFLLSPIQNFYRSNFLRNYDQF